MDTTKITEQAALLFNTLKALNFPVLEVDPAKAQVGPSLVRYRVRLGVGARLASLRSHAEDIGRELASPTIPIIDNIPGEAFVGFDIPRPDRVNVPFKPAMANLKRPGPFSMPLAIGVTPAGDDVVHDLVDLPHVLVAGSTGSGKTVFLHTIVASVAECAVPKADIVIVDPKATDFTVYNGSPKLGPAGRVITEPLDAVAMLQKLTTEELPRRTKLLHSARAANLKDYLSMGKTDLRPIVVVVDEYADLLMVLPKKERAQLESDVTRLAQRARSVGIHLVLATQRPTVDVVTGQIKANLPIRVGFRLPQAIDSRVVLDQSGAEALLGKGDMLLSLGDNLTRLQGYFLDTAAIKSLLTEGLPPTAVERIAQVLSLVPRRPTAPAVVEKPPETALEAELGVLVEQVEAERMPARRFAGPSPKWEAPAASASDEGPPRWMEVTAAVIGTVVGFCITVCSFPILLVIEFVRGLSNKDTEPSSGPEPDSPEPKRIPRTRRRARPFGDVRQR